MNLNMDKVIVRPFEERDRESVRRICRETGLKGDPARLFFEDEEIIPLLYVDYYLDHEPHACFVADVSSRVVGYIIGSVDAHRRRRIMLIRIYPRVARRILGKLLTLQYRDRETFRTLWWIATRSWREALPRPADRYSAHAHFNVGKDYRGRHLGRRLAVAFRRYILSKGVKGLYAIIREQEGQELLSAFLCRERGYRIIAVRRNTLWEKSTGCKWYARLLVCDVKPLAGEEDDEAGLR
jgi:ribosomal protein S18 acetylase RimI-like enzyme